MMMMRFVHVLGTLDRDTDWDTDVIQLLQSVESTAIKSDDQYIRDINAGKFIVEDYDE